MPRLKIATLFDVELIGKARNYAQEYIGKLEAYPELSKRIAILQEDIHPVKSFNYVTETASPCVLFCIGYTEHSLIHF